MAAVDVCGVYLARLDFTPSLPCLYFFHEQGEGGKAKPGAAHAGFQHLT